MQFKKTVILLILFSFYVTVFSQDSDKYKLFEHANYDFP